MKEIIQKLAFIIVLIREKKLPFPSFHPMLKISLIKSPVFVLDLEITMCQIVLKSSDHFIAIRFQISSKTVHFKILEQPIVNISFSEYHPALASRLILLKFTLIDRTVLEYLYS